ncbi:MAG: heme-binding protein [Candidatus Paceibacterota bacterium]|jgi:uncharacterized protein GlcG (DUF336 family)
MNYKDLFSETVTVSALAANILGAHVVKESQELIRTPGCVISVVNLSGVELFKTHTSDDVLPISHEAAYKKAITALAFKKSTYALSHDEPDLILPEKYCMWQGGILIPCINENISSDTLEYFDRFLDFIQHYSSGHCGAIGVSGFDGETDEKAAARGLWCWFSELKEQGFFKS